MAPLCRFSEGVSEEELNALIQKAIPEKTKIASKYRKKLTVPLGKVNAVEQGFGIIRIVLSIDITYIILINNLIQFDSWSGLFFSFFSKLFKVQYHFKILPT